MIAVDTNIVIRLLAKDDEAQFQKSWQLFQTQEIFISDTVILEVEWVLRFAYKFKPSPVCQALRNLLGLSNVQIFNPATIAQALEWHEKGLDFADALHLAKSQECLEFYTFDRKLFNKSQNLSKCEVKIP